MDEMKKDTSMNREITQYEKNSQAIKSKLSKRDVNASFVAKENEIIHGTWMIEQQILSLIREGNVEGIRRLFVSITKEGQLNEGPLADTPLRQEKNVFIGLVALIGKTAGIEGGIDVEEAYRMVDIYTQECEAAATVDEIYVLRYHMIIDFTERVRQAQVPGDISPETVKAMHYINSHIYGNIAIDEIAAYLGISRSTLTKHFRADLKKSIVEYVTDEKIKEAKRLLMYSDMTISEIAEYLGYSGQPYFQTVFKKKTGKTPYEYIKRTFGAALIDSE